MNKFFTLAVSCFLLSSCGEEIEFISFPFGNYTTICLASGSDSIKTEISIARDFKSQTTQTFTYPGVSNCSGTGVATSEETVNEISIIFSNEDLGDNFSYLTLTYEEDGLEQVEFQAFRFENSTLHLSPTVTSLGANPKLTFSDFLSNPDFSAETILIRKDLNRSLSKN